MKKTISKLKKLIKKPTIIFDYLLNIETVCRLFPDSTFLKMKYRLIMGKKLDLKNPKTFNEKLQWLKLYDRNPKYTTMVDKYKVREYVAEAIGEEYLIPLLGVWDNADDIDFQSLPEQFVLKCNHDSGGVVICKDKSKLDIDATKKKLNKSLKKEFYRKTREWPYKNVCRKIIAEKYIEDSNGVLIDYKFFCFDGVVYSVMVCLERETGDTKFYFFDREWNLLRINKRGVEAPEGFTVRKPKCIDKMFDLASALSKTIPFSRIDLYEVDDKIYFGEITFFPDSGFDPNILHDTDLNLGSMIDLGRVNKSENNWISDK